MVLVSRENRRKIHEYLLNEDTEVPNLQVWMVMRSLHSKGIVELVFNWLYFYYYVKTEGVKFLRDSLGISEENIVPATFKKTNRNFESREDREAGEDRPRGRGRGRGRGARGGRRGGRGFGRGGRRGDEDGAPVEGEQVEAQEVEVGGGEGQE